ncbi:MAG: 50S ribosomal protein L9, partial [Polyangiales bacterium]
EKIVAQLAKVTIMVAKEAGDDGKLFGSVTSNDVIDGLKSKGVELEIDKKKLVMPAQTIKEVGSYEIGIKLPYGLTAAVKLEVKTRA